MRNWNCALDEDSAGVTIVGSRTNLGVPALTNLLPQTSLNVATRSPELTQLAVADSKEKKNSEPFPGILQWGAAFWPTTWLLNGGNFCTQQQSSSSSSNRFLLTRRFDPETRAFFGYTSKLSNRPIYTFMLLCLGVQADAFESIPTVFVPPL